MRFRESALLASVVLLSACDLGAGDPTTGDEADLTAKSGGFQVSLNTLASSNGTARVHGLANVPLEGAFAFIPDDQIGTTKVAPKSFTSSFAPSELTIFLRGKPVFFSINTASTSHYDARGDLGVKMHIDSPVGVKVTSSAETVLVGGVPVVRVRGTFVDPLVEAKTSVDGVDVPGVVSGKSWRFDYPVAFMAKAIANKTQIWILLTTQFDDFSGELDASLRMKKVAITTDDPYVVWAPPACSPSILACIQEPANAVDTSACGVALDVAPCWKQLHP